MRLSYDCQSRGVLIGTRIGLRLLEPMHCDLYRALYTSVDVMQAIGPLLILAAADA